MKISSSAQQEALHRALLRLALTRPARSFSAWADPENCAPELLSALTKLARQGVHSRLEALAILSGAGETPVPFLQALVNKIQAGSSPTDEQGAFLEETGRAIGAVRRESETAAMLALLRGSTSHPAVCDYYGWPTAWRSGPIARAWLESTGRSEKRRARRFRPGHDHCGYGRSFGVRSSLASNGRPARARALAGGDGGPSASPIEPPGFVAGHPECRGPSFGRGWRERWSRGPFCQLDEAFNPPAETSTRGRSAFPRAARRAPRCAGARPSSGRRNGRRQPPADAASQRRWSSAEDRETPGKATASDRAEAVEFSRSAAGWRSAAGASIRQDPPAVSCGPRRRGASAPT